MDVPPVGGGEAILHTLVWLGGAPLVPVKEVAATLRGHLDGASDRDSVAEGPQQQDHDYQAQGRRLPQPIELHHGDLFPLRRLRRIPTVIRTRNGVPVASNTGSLSDRQWAVIEL